MKENIIVGAAAALVLLALTGAISKNVLVGVWESPELTLVFEADGDCVVDGETGKYTPRAQNRVRIYTRTGGYEEYAYMLSFDKKSMYFGSRRYIKRGQSGLESSIIGFLL